MDKESVCEVGQNGTGTVDTPPAGGGDKAAKIKKSSHSCPEFLITLS